MTWATCVPLGAGCPVETDFRCAGVRVRQGSRLHAPVELEHRAQRADDRPFGAHHRVHPLAHAVLLLEEPGIDEIHAAGVRDPAVDDDDLAVQPQVDAPERDLPRAHGERDLQLDARGAHAGGPVGLQELLAAERVEQQSHGGAARDRACERVGDFIRRAARVPDVELHLHARLRSVHVRDDGAQDPLRSALELERRPGQWPHACRAGGKPGQPVPGWRELARFAARIVGKCGHCARHACEELPRKLRTTPADRSLADQHVGG